MYNTIAALVQTGPPNDDTALPSIAPSALPSNINTGLLACLNETTDFAVPLIGMDPPKTSQGETIFVYALGGIVFLFILICLIV
jgi:hypothetical protein